MVESILSTTHSHIITITFNTFEIKGKTIKGGSKHIFYVSTEDEKTAIIDEFIKISSDEEIAYFFRKAKDIAEMQNVKHYRIVSNYLIFGIS